MSKTIFKMRTITMREIANGLSISRVFLGLAIILLLSNGIIIISWLLLLIGGITDILDGYIARRADKVSTFGAILDPLTDKIMLFAPFIWLSSNNIVPNWSIWLLISREVLISSWRSNKKDGGPASKLGKMKTILQFLSLLMILWPNKWGSFMLSSNIHSIGINLYWVSLIVSLSSALKYVNSNQLKEYQ